MALPWTTNRQFVAPAAANGVSVTPSSVAFDNSAWVDVPSSVAVWGRRADPTISGGC
jgi:hypothetical protein